MKKGNKKLFRFHRSDLTDSLDTTIEVDGLGGIKDAVYENVEVPFTKLRILQDEYPDSRLPYSLGWHTQFVVVADVGGYKDQLIGFSNFFE